MTVAQALPGPFSLLPSGRPVFGLPVSPPLCCAAVGIFRRRLSSGPALLKRRPPPLSPSLCSLLPCRAPQRACHSCHLTPAFFLHILLTPPTFPWPTQSGLHPFAGDLRHAASPRPLVLLPRRRVGWSARMGRDGGGGTQWRTASLWSQAGLGSSSDCAAYPRCDLLAISDRDSSTVGLS